MRIIQAFPPNWDDIVKVLKPPPNVIICYAPAVYIPAGGTLTPSLEAHEGVHLLQQGNSPATWWIRYLHDLDFRLAQEVPAHAAEYNMAIASGASRQVRRSELKQIAKRLSGPLYGKLITFKQARLEIMRLSVA